MTIAPWLQSPNVLQIAQAGTQAGLGLRHQNLAEATEAQQAQQAADLLDFHYQQLQAEQQQKQSALAQHAEATKEALAGRAAQEQALELHRRAIEAHQLNQEDRAMKAAQALEQHRNAIEAHQLAMEQAAQDRLNKPVPEFEPEVRDVPGFGPVLYNKRTGSIHTKPTVPSADEAINKVEAAAAARALYSPSTLDADRDKARLVLEKFRSKQKPSGGTAIPKEGDVQKGYTFLGGDPADQDSWEKVE